MRDKLQDRAGDLLPGGKYHNPSPATRKRLRTAPSNNDASERLLGSLKYLMHNSPNLTLINARTIVMLRTNNTITDFLKLDPKDRDRQLKVACKMRVKRQKENREHEHGVQLAKAVATRVNRDKNVAAQGKRDDKKKKVLSIVRASSVDEANTPLPAFIPNIHTIALSWLQSFMNT